MEQVEKLKTILSNLNDLLNLAHEGLLKSEKLYNTRYKYEDELKELGKELDERDSLLIEKTISPRRGVPKSGVFVTENDVNKQLLPLIQVIDQLIIKISSSFKISDNKHSEYGGYKLTDSSKIERAKKESKQGASDKEVFINYDKIAGRIEDKNGNVVPPQTFWKIENAIPNKAIDEFSDQELLSIIRKSENTHVPGSLYQRANTEWQIRHQQKILEATKRGGGGIMLQVGGDMINDGIIHTDENAQIDIAVAGSYLSKKGKIIQSKQEAKDIWWKRPEIIITIVIAIISIPYWPAIFDFVVRFAKK